LPGWSLAGSPRPNRARPGGYLARLWRGDPWVLRRPSVGEDDPEARERQVVSGISWMSARFSGTSGRSAGLLSGAEFNAELERGRGTATAPASRESFVEVRDAEAARESRMQTLRMAGTSRQH